MADEASVKACRTSRGVLLLAAILVAGAMVLCLPARAADKTKRSKERSSSSSSSNDSIRTQQETGDAFAQKLRGDAPTSRPAQSPDEIRAALADLDDQVQTENDRHESAVAALKKSSRSSSAKKALAKEQMTHDDRLASLDEQRQGLLANLNGKSRSATTKPAPPEGESSALPLELKKSKRSSSGRSR